MRNECEWHRSPCHLLVVMHACLQPVERITEASKKLSVGRSRQHRQHRAWEEWGPLLRQPAKHTHPAPPSACCVASFVCARAASPCVPPSGTLRHARIRWAPRPSRCTVSVTRTQNPCHGSFPMEDGDARVSCVRSVLSTRAMRVGGGSWFRLARVQGPSSSPPSAGAMCSYALPLHNAHPPSVAPRPPYHNRLIALKNSRVPNCRRSHPPTLCSAPQAL